MDCVHMTDLNTLQNLQQRFATLQVYKIQRSVTQRITMLHAALLRSRDCTSSFMKSQTTHTVARRIVAAETCCTAYPLPVAADCVYCVE